ncbi:MAG TPA: molybdopterin molybdotransferase MoeA [Syntrophomonadaceae bacterium]|nr:molybdopterin molybdotransferase MoeA [Syntrophomonadaceae bacterium]
MLVNRDVEEVQSKIVNSIPHLGNDSVSILESVGRVSAENLYASTSLPANRQSAVDGYALAYLEGESLERYALTGNLALGEMSKIPLQIGEAIGVGTGGNLPEGTVTVIPHENTKIVDDFLYPTKSIRLGDNIKQIGEDYHKDDLLIAKNQILGPGEVGLLAAFGKTEVLVYPKPKVAMLSLSENIVPWQETPNLGQMRDSNGPLLSALAVQDGAIPTLIKIADKDENTLKKSILELSEQVDIIIISGGTYSENDNEARLLIEDMGGKTLYWGVPIQPGSHTGAAVLNSSLVFALSGNPASCAVGYALFVGTAIRAIQGLNPYLSKVKAKCTNGFPKKTGSRRFVRGYLSYDKEGFKVSVQPGQKPSMVRSLIECNALIDLPSNNPPVDPGQEVTVLLLNTLYSLI